MQVAEFRFERSGLQSDSDANVISEGRISSSSSGDISKSLPCEIVISVEIRGDSGEFVRLKSVTVKTPVVWKVVVPSASSIPNSSNA